MEFYSPSLKAYYYNFTNKKKLKKIAIQILERLANREEFWTNVVSAQQQQQHQPATKYGLLDKSDADQLQQRTASKNHILVQIPASGPRHALPEIDRELRQACVFDRELLNRFDLERCTFACNCPNSPVPKEQKPKCVFLNEWKTIPYNPMTFWTTWNLLAF